PVRFLQPAIAGFLLGAIAIVGFPQILGAGYQFIDRAMHDQYTWQMLAILAGLKIAATTISYVSGTPGGMFAPTLFVGIVLGGGVRTEDRLWFSTLSRSTSTYAHVRSGVIIAGALPAPLTTMYMTMSSSSDYSSSTLFHLGSM